MSIYGMALPVIQADHEMLTGMARTGRPKAELTLSDNERATLQRWARRAKSSQAPALRANIILTCAQGHDNRDTAAMLRCHESTVGKWRKRFTDRRLDGLADEPRPGREPTITDEQVEKVVAGTLEETPDDATHWSRASMSFGVMAEAYERFRPGYPVELVDVVMRNAGQPVRTALEIGAGTGKATRLFAQRGLTVTATEPDGDMLAELRKHVPANVRTEQLA